MSFIRQLMCVAFTALAALLVVAVAMAAYASVDSMLHANSTLGPASSAQIGFGYTAIIGVLPVMLLGVPGYVALLRRNLARWPYVLLLGIAPGLVAIAFDLSLGFWAIICGASVASLTHLVCRRLGPNNSFKPNPLR